LDKPEFEHCEHECEEGCGIYAKRPKSCREFDCGWLQGLTAPGFAADDLRPDKTGLVPVLQNTKFGPAWTLFQTQEGARDSVVGSALVDHLYRQAPVVLMTKGNRKWIVHPRFASVLKKIREMRSGIDV
jgi:hypothetical protein